MAGKIFCVTSWAGLGCTFLDWSIHYLSNQTSFYSTTHGNIPLSENPVTKINAHGHLRNHPQGYDKSIQVIDQLKKSSNELCSFYPSITGPAETFENSKDDILKDYVKIFNECDSQGLKVVYVELPNFPVYHLRYRQEKRTGKESYTSDINTHYTDFVNTFFNESFSNWSTKEKWDLRELLALNLRPFESDAPDIRLSDSQLYVNAQDLFFNHSVYIDILNFLDLELNQERFEKWKIVHMSWQQIQSKILSFAWNLDYIVKCIVENRHYDLSYYNLELWQEAVIQHILIYKHDLTFKAFGLEKLPSNTKDLHNLLEPNIYHKVDDIYNRLS